MRPSSYLSIFALPLLRLSAAGAAAGPLPLSGSAAAPLGGPLRASWIWTDPARCHDYNQTIVARRIVDLGQPVQAVIRITADSFYRLSINERWVNDGPCRSWPEHFQYDVIDVTPYLDRGQNRIDIIARYYGVGDFHRVPRQAGLLAQLDVLDAGPGETTVLTDASWLAAPAPAWIANTPKVSIQMEPAELYDARLEGEPDWRPAAVLFAADAGPWQDLTPRDVAFLTRKPVALRAFLAARVVRAAGLDFCLPAARLVNPGVIEANHTVSCACGMATVLDTAAGCELLAQTDGMRLAIDGREDAQGRFRLAPGRHPVLALVRDVCGHDKEKSLRLLDPAGFTLSNPLDPAAANPWCFLRFPEFAFAKDDLRWIGFREEDPEVARILGEYARESERLLASVGDLESFRRELGARAEPIPPEAMFVRDTAWQFQQRRPIRDALDLVERPSALLYDTPDQTVVHPSRDGDLELCYDLGEQNCGYYSFELIAEAGVEVDIYGVEYIAPDGRLQHTGGNRNGMRYITKNGLNRFTSLKRRSGRYVFLTLRNQKAPVRIRCLSLIESTYPVDFAGSFSCSDARLERIWEISARTLKLCMEDSFTDCPLYEQTLWVGDARNESLFAYGVFGAHDLARRCITLTAQSLDRFPFAGCQVPSCWETLLPAWSFLWGISVWDHYWHTGDVEFLASVWPDVLRNLKGTERFVNEAGLFSGPFWNLFDWAGIDQGQKTVLHNSMFMIGAIDAARRMAEVLGDPSHNEWLEALRGRLSGGVNRLWDPAAGSYPDSVRDDGTISRSSCQHTSFLAMLYDILEPAQDEAALRNVLDPPERMVRVGSPFAMLYLYEALEKLGRQEEIIGLIYRHYLPMLESGATTVWESFPTGTTGSGGFPTRSHCHAWSSAPVYFLNRVLLGIRPTAAGGKAVEISPYVLGAEWARGATATILGPVQVSWSARDGVLAVEYSAPPGVTASFRRNRTHDGWKLLVNGREPAP